MGAALAYYTIFRWPLILVCSRSWKDFGRIRMERASGSPEMSAFLDQAAAVVPGYRQTAANPTADSGLP